MANDTWRTPLKIFEYYDGFYNFKYDICADHTNALCEHYFTEEQNCLKQNGYVKAGNYVWCNPPYSNPLTFVQHLINQSFIYGIGSVLLVNHDMSVEWSSLLCEIECTHHVFIASGSKQDKTYCNGRIAFIDENNKPIAGNNKGQIAVIIPPFVRYGEPKVKYMQLSSIMCLQL